MKPNKKKYLYICENCDHEFYLKSVFSDHPFECARCGEKAAYYVEDYLEDEIDMETSDDNDFMDSSLLTDYEYDDNFNYSE